MLTVRNIERKTCIYATREEQQNSIIEHEKQGYKCVGEGAASFDLREVKDSQGFKTGELYLFANFERNNI